MSEHTSRHHAWSGILRSVRAAAVLGAAIAALAPHAAAAAPESQGTPADTAAANKAQLAESYGRLPMSFEANQGQAAQDVRFMARGQGYALYLTNAGAVLALHKPQSSAAFRGLKRRARVGGAPEVLGLVTPGKGAASGRPELDRAGSTATETASAAGAGADAPLRSGDGREAAQADVVQMQLEGARTGLQPAGVEALPGTANYIVGKDASKWHTGVPTYAQVRYAGVYPGVDLLYYGNQRQLEYDFVVAAGADPKPIRLRFDGAKSLKLDGAGNLVIAAGNGDVAFQKPVVYQMEGGRRRPVKGDFRLLGDNSAGFTLGSYDRSKPLVIDPVLSYATYLGGTDQEYIVAIAADTAGNTYVTGLTWSIDFPLTPGAYETVNFATTVNSVSTAFISKLNASGTALIYSTYLGGDAEANTEFEQGDYGHSIAVDTNGNAYVTGWTYSANFPVTPNAYQTTNFAAAVSEATGFVSKLNPTGTGLVYSTYLGGSTLDEPTTLALDANGNVYTTGYTFSSDYPVTSGAFQTTNNSFLADGWNAFVTKLNPTGTGLLYSTFLGGSGESGATINGIYAPLGLAVDKNGDAFVAGFANSSDFPVTSGAYQTTNHASVNAGTNITVSELNPTGTGLIYSTYLGGSSALGDFTGGLAIDGTDNAYVTGYTYSSDFPTTTGAFQTVNSEAANFVETGFATKINPTGTGLVYSTFLGGSGNPGVSLSGDDAYALALDGSGDLYLTGATSSINFPVTAGAYQSTNKAAGVGGTTAFFTELNPAGSGLVYSTFLGGSTDDGGYGVALGSGGVVYLGGATASPDFPVTPDAFQTVYESKFNTAFVAELDLGTLPTTQPTKTTLISSVNPQLLGGAVTFTATVAPISGSGVPAGNVVFSVDEVTVATVALNGSGQAMYLATSLGAGEHYVLASYAGNSTYASSGQGLIETILPPVISSLSPFVATAGGAGFTLTVNGTGFISGATVMWGGTALVTTYVNSSQLTAQVPAALIAAAGSVDVTVAVAGGASAPAIFTITPTSKLPLLLSLSPASATESGASFTLTVYGANFASNARVLWNGAVRTTTFVSSTELQATVLTSDIAAEGTDLVTVANGAPNPATSAAQPFAVMNASPVATITAASLAVAADGQGNHGMTLTGTDFVPDSVVQWNGVSLPTTYVSPWQISAVVSATDIESLPVVVTVQNPGGTSAGFEAQ